MTTNIHTIDTETATKTDLIAVLVDYGQGTARALRDRRKADLVALVNIVRDEQAIRFEPETEAVTFEGIESDAFYTVAEIAELVGLTKAAVRRWFRLGYLPNTEPPQAHRARQQHVLGSDLAAFLTERETSSAKSVA